MKSLRSHTHIHKVVACPDYLTLLTALIEYRILTVLLEFIDTIILLTKGLAKGQTHFKQSSLKNPSNMQLAIEAFEANKNVYEGLLSV